MAISGTDLDFRILREDWNVYELSDGTTLKVRFVLLKIIRTKAFNPDGEPVYGFASQNFLAPRSPKEIMAPPTNPPPTKEQVDSSNMVEVDFKVKEEGWNEYQVEDGTKARMKLVVTKVERSDFYDQMGYPFYRVASHAASSFSTPSALKRDQQKAR